MSDENLNLVLDNSCECFLQWRPRRPLHEFDRLEYDVCRSFPQRCLSRLKSRPSGQRDRRSIATVRQMQIGLGLVFLTRIDPVE